jgi:hypothetical protein
MAYIGRDTDKISNVEVLDNITFDGSSSYTLQKGGSNFTPSSANTLLVSIDGVVQAGNFTVSGSTIDFGTAVAGTSTCDFILHYGIGLITAPSDGTVTTAKLGDSAVTTAKLNDASVSLAKLTATGTKDATTFLRGDNTFAEAGGGGVLQIKSSVNTGVSSTTGTSYSNTIFTVGITPTSSSSKVLVILQSTVQIASGRGSLGFNRSGYGDLWGDVGGSAILTHEGATVRNHAFNMIYIDSPATTNAITYTTRFKSDHGGSLSLGGHGGAVTLMYAIELDGGVF